MKKEDEAWKRMNEEEDKLLSKVQQKAYEETYNYLKKESPEYLKEIEADAKRSGNDRLDRYHDFDVIQDGFMDDIYDSKEFKAYRDKISSLEKEYYRYFDEAKSKGNKIIRDVLEIEGPTQIRDIKGRYSTEELLKGELRYMIEKTLPNN